MKNDSCNQHVYMSPDEHPNKTSIYTISTGGKWLELNLSSFSLQSLF